MSILKLIIISIPIIIILKLATNLFMKMYNFNDEKLKFIMDVKANSINKMTALEFEGFCKWLFESTNCYKDVYLKSSNNNEEIDIILTDSSNHKIYVECKRYNNENNTDSNTSNFIIEQEVCQKLAGAMIANNINHGIIMTTGSIHQSAIDYIDALRENSNLDIEFITMKDIVDLLSERQEDDEYSLVVEI